MRKLGKALIVIGLMLLLTAPLATIFMLSKAEIKKYEPQPVPPLVEKAYGEIHQVERMDISETIEVEGVFVSTKKIFMDLPWLQNPYNARMLVEFGDEIHEGQLIGYSEDLKTEIRATASGIVQNINLGTSSYITLESLKDVALDCRVDEITLSVLSREGLEMTTQGGEKVKVLSVSKTQDEQGLTSVLLSVPNGVYGKSVESLLLQTGRVFQQTLVIDASCVFHLDGDSDRWAVRTVDDNGNYIDDVEVEVSYSDGNYIAVSGVPEGTLCDGGYQKIAEEVYG